MLNKNCCTLRRKPLKAQRTGFAMKCAAVRLPLPVRVPSLLAAEKVSPMSVPKVLPMSVLRAVRGNGGVAGSALPPHPRSLSLGEREAAVVHGRASRTAYELHPVPVRAQQPVLDERDRKLGDVYADPLAPQLLGGVNRRAAAAEGVEDPVAGVAAGFDDALNQGEGLLRWVAETLVCLRVDRRNVGPNII